MRNWIIVLLVLGLVCCVSGAQAFSVQVPTSTQQQTTWTAPTSSLYTITASGLWTNLIYDGGEEVDAAGYVNIGKYYGGADSWVTEHDNSGAVEGLLELLVNNQRVGWGSFRSDHNYSIQRYVNVGEVLGFSIADSYPFVEPRYGQVMDWYGDNNGFLTVDINPVPEPSSLLALASGFGIFGGMIRRRRK